MNNNKIRRIVIVGGGTSGWMTAAAMSALLPANAYDITLIESDQIGTIGVGEATIPPMQLFNREIGIKEDEFIKETGATFKLGIEFHNWKKQGEHYFHPFGQYGRKLDATPFHQYWLRANKRGTAAKLGEYSLCEIMARTKKFAPTSPDPKSVLSTTGYAYHLDAGLYAKFLRKNAEKKGVKRVEGKVIDVTLREPDGFIQSVTLESSKVIAGDLFIDCSGFRGLLIEEALKTGYEDWSHYLLCDKALAVPSENVDTPRPYTMCTAHKAGWQWRIPLQHRTGNGHVYCSKYTSDDEAASTLLANLEGKALGEPRQLKFTTGRRKKFWNKNCIAIGLSAGFMEPLESTSIHLIQKSITHLITSMPGKEFNRAEIDEFNNINSRDYELIRDFLILHYHLNERTEDFWKHCRTMDVPDSLKHKIALFKNRGRISVEEENLFRLDSWLAVLHGQGITPNGYDPLADCHNKDTVGGFLSDVKSSFVRATKAMPTHEEFIDRHCKSSVGKG